MNATLLILSVLAAADAGSPAVSAVSTISGIAPAPRGVPQDHGIQGRVDLGAR